MIRGIVHGWLLLVSIYANNLHASEDMVLLPGGTFTMGRARAAGRTPGPSGDR
jgi:hypothetical protein